MKALGELAGLVVEVDGLRIVTPTATLTLRHCYIDERV
jgi:hypothetical protein